MSMAVMYGAQENEDGKWLALLLAVAVHLVLLAMLIWGVSWHNTQPAGVEAELWSDLPVAPQVAVKQSAPKSAARSQPQPEPKAEPKPAPEPKPVQEERVQPAKPDIALKQPNKEEKPKEKVKEPPKEVEKKPEPMKKETKKTEPAPANDPILQELMRQQAQLAQMQKQQAVAAAQAASAGNKLKADYIDKISAKIKHNVVVPPDIVGNPEAVFDVTLLPGGSVLNVRLIKSSGNSGYDSAVERAIRKSDPLPLPPDPALFSEFRDLKLTFHPFE